MSHTTIQQVVGDTDIRPGEVVLGNRIRMVFPARIRDAMLPKLDNDLIRMVRGVFDHTHLTAHDARMWVFQQFFKVESEMESTELELCKRRIAKAFVENKL